MRAAGKRGSEEATGMGWRKLGFVYIYSEKKRSGEEIERRRRPLGHCEDCCFAADPLS